MLGLKLIPQKRHVTFRNTITMALKIKYPTLITSELPTHHRQYNQMKADVINKIDNYNNRSLDQKLRIPYIGKSKVKVIKAIHTDCYDIGQIPTIQICIEEYKEGYDDLYLQQQGVQDVTITPNDKIGSNKNYALLYPIIEQEQQAVNKWLVIIYDTPSKDDADITHTVKYVVRKIFDFPFKYVIPTTINGQRVIPKIEVSYTTIENIENEHFALQDYIVSTSSKKRSKVEYANVPSEHVSEIINDNANLTWNLKRVVKIFFDHTNKNAYSTYTTTVDENGVISTEMVSKYSYSDEIEQGDMFSIHEDGIMRARFAQVISNYLSNGNNV